jgi:tetratricopeptide (TPR) repeat protein
MAFVPGSSLASLLVAGPLDPRVAARIAEDVALGLAHCHAAGVVHRDVKPGNVLVDTSGRAVLTDFGLAKPEHVAESLTQTGQLLGTPSYMAPEQIARPKAASPQADIYGLGATLYHMLVGEVPFPAETLPQLLDRVANEEPADPTQVRPEVDARLAALCLDCLQKDPWRRPASAAQLAQDLRDWRAASGATPPLIGAGPPWQVIGAATLSVCLVAGALAWSRRPAPPRTPAALGEAPAGAVTPAPAPSVSDRLSALASQLNTDAERLLNAGLLEEAFALFGRVLELDPRVATAHLNRGSILYQRGDLEAALASYERGAALRPTRSDGWADVGLIRQELDDHAGALAAFRRLAELGDPIGHYQAGIELLNLRRFAEALSAARAFEQALPDDPDAHLLTGRALMKLRRLEEAHQAYDRALELAPRHAKARFSRALLLHDQGELEAALRDYTLALELEPELPEGRLNRGRVLSRLRRYEEARDGYVRAVEAGDESCYQPLLILLTLGAPGLRADHEAALRWARRGEELDWAGSDLALGLLHLNGWGLEQDRVEGRRRLERAAERGSELAHYTLGKALVDGDLLPRDLPLGRAHLEKAAALGFLPAKQLVERGLPGE